MPGIAAAARAGLSALAERGGLPPPPVFEGLPLGFRHRARLAVRGRAQNPKIGIFDLGSHRVVHIPDCRIHHPVVNEAVAGVRRALVEHRVAPYSDAAHAGTVRYLQVVIERDSQTAQLVIVTRDSELPRLEPFFASVREELGPRLHSLWWNGQPERNNRVLGANWRRLAGPPAVSETFLDTRVFYPPGAFGQSHLELAARIGQRVAELVPSGARLAEFYAGVGALGLPLAARVERLSLNEVGEDSLAGLRLGISELRAELQSRIQVHPGSAADCAALSRSADVVLVDPPRKGLDAPLLDALCEAPPRRLIYVSCGLDSLQRDSERLLKSGRARLTSLEAYALFPYTEHVETLAVFDADH